MRFNKFLSSTALTFLTILTLNKVEACNPEDDQSKSSLTATSEFANLSFEQLAKLLEDEENHNHSLIVGIAQQEEARKKAEEERQKQEYVQQILATRAAREDILKSVGSSQNTANANANTATISTREEATQETPEATSSASTSTSTSTALNSEEIAKLQEQATLEYKISLGQKIGEEIQRHFSPFTVSSQRQSLGLAWEGFAKTLPLIAQHCTGKLPWDKDGQTWYNALVAHAYDNGSQVKHGRANGLYNGQRPGKKQDQFDSKQIVIDCWKSTQGFHSRGILWHVQELDLNKLVGQTQEEFINARVAELTQSSYSMVTPPSSPNLPQLVDSTPTEEPAQPVIQASTASIGAEQPIESLHGWDRLGKNITNEGIKAEQKVKKFLGK